MRRRFPWFLLVLAAAAGGVFGATRYAGDDGSLAPPTPTGNAPTTTGPPATTSPSTDPPHPVSLQALMQKEIDGRDFRVGRELGRSSAYTTYAISYRTGSLRISGLMNVPRGRGPFPVLVLAHGYIDPDVYSTGRGFERSQAYLGERGFVVVHVDYRNHAASDDDPDSDLRLRLGYAEDVIGAVLAVRRSGLRYVDVERIGLLGRSMGGGVALNAAVLRPDLVDAIVLFAPVSSDAVDNFNRWIRGREERRRLAQRIIAAYGAPAENPTFWRNISAVNFFERVAVPIMIHHGTADESVPIAWSRDTLAALHHHGKDARLLTYEGEGHAFGAAYPRSMARTVTFFREHLRAD